MTIAVTGAHGWIGTFVCEWLASAGSAVRRVVRQARTPEEFEWDATGQSSAWQLRQALDGCQAVIHCAAHVHRPIETTAEVALFQQVNVEGTRQLIDQCLAAGVNCFVYASTIAFYNWPDAGAVTEEASVSRSSEYCRTKLEAENLVRTSGLDWRVGRLATVFGDGDKANFLKLARALKSGRFWVPGAGAARKSVLPVTAAAELLGRLALLSEPPYRTVNLASTHAPTLREICDAFSLVCGFHRARSAPRFSIAALARLGDYVSSTGLPYPLTTSTFHKLMTSTVVDVSRQQTLFGDLRWAEFNRELAVFRNYYR